MNRWHRCPEKTLVFHGFCLSESSHSLNRITAISQKSQTPIKPSDLITHRSLHKQRSEDLPARVSYRALKERKKGEDLQTRRKLFCGFCSFNDSEWLRHSSQVWVTHTWHWELHWELHLECKTSTSPSLEWAVKLIFSQKKSKILHTVFFWVIDAQKMSQGSLSLQLTLSSECNHNNNQDLFGFYDLGQRQ